MLTFGFAMIISVKKLKAIKWFLSFFHDVKNSQFCGPVSSTVKNDKLLGEQFYILIANVFQRTYNISQNNVFLLKTFTPRRLICLTQAVILSSATNFFATIAPLCNNVKPQVKITTNIYIFCLCHTL